ncbi:hypothetical protein [Chromobacterium subtsugae]|uniref:hypothetical protein n=1 Tax=Chromobacterium subtsugae TaxID=251747 RepID=UPI000B2EA0D1|nr:hypothetical protein [Chromobacterium subtsugae]
MQFLPEENYSKEEAKVISKSDDKFLICKMLTSLSSIDDFEWTQTFLLTHIGDEDLDINRCAIYGLAGVARNFGKIDKMKFQQAILDIPAKHAEELAGVIQDALDDFTIYTQHGRLG